MLFYQSIWTWIRIRRYMRYNNQCYSNCPLLFFDARALNANYPKGQRTNQYQTKQNKQMTRQTIVHVNNECFLESEYEENSTQAECAMLLFRLPVCCKPISFLCVCPGWFICGTFAGRVPRTPDWKIINRFTTRRTRSIVLLHLRLFKFDINTNFVYVEMCTAFIEPSLLSH